MSGHGSTTLHVDRELGQMWAIQIEKGSSDEDGYSVDRWVGLSPDGRLWPLKIQPGRGLPIAEKVRGTGFGSRPGILVVNGDAIRLDAMYGSTQRAEWKALLVKFEGLAADASPDC